ncbi:MAG: hypothetical protein ACE5EY_17940, partial [Anaerolineae bacterium]
LFFEGDGRLPLLYLPALLSGLGGLALIIGLPLVIGQLLVFLGGLGLVGLFGLILKRQTALHTIVMSLGAVCLAAGEGLWLAGRPLHIVVWWWIGFLVLTIAGERLELSRLTKLTQNQQTGFTAVNGLFLLGILVSLFWYVNGVRIAGLGLLGIALWLFRYDIARRTIRRTGQPRFAAASLLSGYFWLAAAGLIALIFGGVPAGLRYDAMLHAVFLGFTFGMIFGHAPVIFPAIANVTMRYHPRFYLHLVLLNLTLLLRIIADLAAWPELRAWGGLLNALVLVIFLVNTVTAVQRQSAGT